MKAGGGAATEGNQNATKETKQRALVAQLNHSLHGRAVVVAAAGAVAAVAAAGAVAAVAAAGAVAATCCVRVPVSWAKSIWLQLTTDS